MLLNVIRDEDIQLVAPDATVEWCVELLLRQENLEEQHHGGKTKARKDREYEFGYS